MRAVQQLITYLNNRGLLSQAQLHYLRLHAFLPSDESETECVQAAAEAICERVEQRAGDRTQPSLDIQEDLERAHLRKQRAQARQRSRRSMGRSRLSQHAPLVRRRPAAYQVNGTVDSTLTIRIARRIEPHATASTAERVIRQAAPERLAQALDDLARRELSDSDERTNSQERGP